MDPRHREEKIEGEKSTKNLHLNIACVNETEKGRAGPGSLYVWQRLRSISPSHVQPQHKLEHRGEPGFKLVRG